ncbi:PIG-L deacetylase family protein [Kocuria sp. M1N1S27]|uniref:PIG-L deacetylase family protein n=1 Tax=Kocuria kalidii TaxID=3376283 RepID=UPI0037B2D68D
MTETPLTHVDENWQRALVVVAHPDDMEFGAAAAVARWTAQGKDVVYCLVTSGEAGIDGLEPEQCGPLREDEQRESCRIVGVEQVEFLHLPDGVLEYGVALRRRIAEVVRRHRPDVVITNNFRDTWDGATALNQADHIATGRATLDAARDAGNRWVFPEQVEAGLQPWPDVTAVWAAASPGARHAADVTETFGAGVESLRAHRAYLEGLGWEDFDPDAFLRDGAAATGERLGVPLASSFEVFPLRWGGSDE